MQIKTTTSLRVPLTTVELQVEGTAGWNVVGFSAVLDPNDGVLKYVYVFSKA